MKNESKMMYIRILAEELGISLSPDSFKNKTMESLKKYLEELKLEKENEEVVYVPKMKRNF